MTVARPGWLVVEDLADAADPRVGGQSLQQRRHTFVLQRRGWHHRVREPPGAELLRDPLSFGGAGVGEGFPFHAGVLRAHHLQKRAADQLEAIAGDIAFVAGQGVSGVVNSRRHIPDMKVRIPELHRGASIANQANAGRPASL